MRPSEKSSREKAIGEILPGLCRRLGLEERMSYSSLLSEWEGIVGDVIAKHSRPKEVIDKKLVVEVDSPVWLHEMSSFSREDILKRIQAKHADIKDVRFKIGAF